MKTLCTLALLTIITVTLSQAQNADASQPDNNGPGMTIGEPPVDMGDPLFVIQVDDRKVELSNDSTNPMNVQQIHASWIESLSVLQGDEAIEEFGDKASNGVVIMALKKDAVNNLPEALLQKIRPD